MDHICIVHEQVAQHIAEAQDETGCHAFKHQTQPNADDGCKTQDDDHGADWATHTDKVLARTWEK
jgi:hypothetical protein